MDVEYEGPKVEEDVPLNMTSKSSFPESEVNFDNKRIWRKEKWAIRLVIGCLIFLAVTYFLDVVLTAAHVAQNEQGSPVVEIIKYIASMSVGYLFAKNSNGE